MRAGKLRCFITIQERSTSQGAAGDQEDVWSDVMTAYASVEPLSGRELIAAQAANSVATHKISMRYAAGVTTAMRVKYGSRFFNIVSPPRNVGEMGREMVFEAEEGLNNG